jgi:hypothetical protein
MLKTRLILTFFLLGLSLRSFSQSARGEIQRFTLLHDRLTIDRQLRERPYSEFLSIDLVLSSGIRTLVNDLSNTSESTASTPIQKQLETLSLLSKNVNTEKTIDALLSAGVPLPDIKIKGHRFYNSLFYQFHAGIQLSINNRANATNPLAQTYVRKQIKKGLATIYRPKAQSNHHDQFYEIALYQLTRADTAVSLSSTQLASNGEFFNLDNLNRDHTFYAADLIYHRRSRTGAFELGAREVQVKSDSEEKSLYGTSPLLHTQFTWNDEGKNILMRPFVGVHYRKWYPLHRGIYGGAHFNLAKKEIPFSLTFKVSNQFLTFMPQFKTSWFHFSYTFKNPYRNPQDEVWVSSLHNIQIHIPFP